MRRRGSWLAAAVVAGVALAGGAEADEPARTFDYVLSNPGARSIGLGGAFAGLADDATAAFANPAGLVQLLRPEISGELRLGSDRLDGWSGVDSTLEVDGLGFASFVWPGRGWSAAFYGHRTVSYEMVSVGPDGSLESGRGITVLSLATSAGVRLHERLSVGAGVSYFLADLDAEGTSNPEDSSWGVNAGLLWRPFDTFRLGGFYRQGPEVEVRLAGDPPSVRWVATPDVSGVGLAFQPGKGSLSLAFELDWLRYPSIASPLASLAWSGDDARQLHLGGEYAFLGWSPVTAFRAGAWLDQSRIREGAGDGVTTEGDVLHGAIGLGLAWTRFQLDFGLDVAETSATLSTSMIYSF